MKQPKLGPYLTRDKAEVLEYILEDAMRSMQRHPDAWPMPVLTDAITEMWGGFWTVVDPVGFR